MLQSKHFKKHPILENIKNVFNVAKAYLHFKTYKKGRFRIFSHRVSAPSGYVKVFEDMFKEDLNPEIWRRSHEWGDFHPGNLAMRFDTTGELSYISDEGLNLKLVHRPKDYVKKDLAEWQQTERMPDEFTIPALVGLVSTKIGWQYGWFEGWIKLPKGPDYWPAFWLSGLNHWPPEIDIFEAYTHSGENYDRIGKNGKKKPFRQIQPNLHYGVEGTDTYDNYHGYDVPVADANERLVQYVCHWERDFIKMYYDGIKVFECTNPEILKWFNGSTDQMHIILNHGMFYNIKGDPQESSMIVRSLRVFQKQDEK